MRKLLLLVALLPLFWAAPAAAAEVRLGLGADLWGTRGRYWHHDHWDGGWGYNGLINGTLAVGFPLNRAVELGGRVGLALVVDPLVFGVPLDGYIRFMPVRNLYLEGLVGPWFFLANHPLRAHVAFGFGYRGDAVHIGLEAAYLEPAPMLGVRLGIPL